MRAQSRSLVVRTPVKKSPSARLLTLTALRRSGQALSRFEAARAYQRLRDAERRRPALIIDRLV
ncbi:MAG: hypothetical protein ACK4NP_00295 [Parvularculaceae bacterium]